MVKINDITIECPDLSGKTTLFNNLHNKTNYEYNIQDRSELSMLAYAILYDRDQAVWRRRLRNKLNNLNHLFVVLLPPLSVAHDRFKNRGDDKHTKSSLTQLYKIFYDLIEEFKLYSTFFVVKEPYDEDELMERVYKKINNSQPEKPELVAEKVRMNALASPNKEAYPIVFETELGHGFMTSITDAFEFESEREYYTKILSKTLTTLTKEMVGDNSYLTKQDPIKTRRFIYADDSCIALFHMMYREGRLNFYATLRSSDIVNIFQHDYKFLLYLCGECAKSVGIKDYEIPEECTLTVTINSAHIIGD